MSQAARKRSGPISPALGRQSDKVCKLADYVGVPRSTVQRRLEELERLGRVEQRGTTWRTPLRALARAEGHDLASIADMIRESLGELDRYPLLTCPLPSCSSPSKGVICWGSGLSGILVVRLTTGEGVSNSV
jgi:DNA-binding transcriptional MocR family regulator